MNVSHRALNYNGDFLPPKGMVIVANFNKWGYTSVHNLMRLFHPSLVNDSSNVRFSMRGQEELNTITQWQRSLTTK